MQCDAHILNIRYYNNKSIFILHYLNEKPYTSYGSINNIIDDKKIEYGSPILSLETFKIIGIHNDISKNNNMNYTTFLKNEINILYKT